MDFVIYSLPITTVERLRYFQDILEHASQSSLILMVHLTMLLGALVTPCPAI
jgi:hypothetical protein